MKFQFSDLLKIKQDASKENGINLFDFLNKNKNINEIVDDIKQPNSTFTKNNYNLNQRSNIPFYKNNCEIFSNFPNVPYFDFFNPLITFDLHPFLPIIAVGSLNQTITLFNFYSKEFISQKNFENEITYTKFSNDGKLLALGFLNGDVIILDSYMTDRNFLENKKRMNLINNDELNKIYKNSIQDQNSVIIESDDNYKANEIDKSKQEQINYKKKSYTQKVLTQDNLNFDNLKLFHIPNLDILQIISNFQTSVILIKFSKNDDFIAISYNNKITFDKDLNINNSDNINENYNINYNYNFQGGSIVSLYIFKFSKLKVKHNFDKKNFYNYNNTSNINNINRNRGSSPKKVGNINSNQHLKEEIYSKLSDVSIPVSQYESTNMNRNECATTAIDFSDDSMYILMENQVYNKNNNSKKEAIYIVWDIENTQLVIDTSLLNKLKFSEFSFSNNIETYDYLNFLNLENRKRKEKLKLIHVNKNDLEMNENEKSSNENNQNDINQKNFKNKKFNLVSNFQDYQYKNIEKHYLEFFQNNNFITSTLTMFNFNFDFEFEYQKNNKFTTNEKIDDLKIDNLNKNNFYKSNISTNSLMKSLINQHLACGSNNGNIHLFRYIYILNDALKSNNSVKKKGYVSEMDLYNSNIVEVDSYQNNEFSNDNSNLKNRLKLLRKEKIGVSRSFSAHCHKINLIKCTSDESFLFTSDVNDQIIIEWKITKENINSDLENFPSEFLEDDPFIESLQKDHFSALVEDYWLGRLRLTEYYSRYFQNNYFNFFFNKIGNKKLNHSEIIEENDFKNLVSKNDNNDLNIKHKSSNQENNNDLIDSNVEFSLSHIIGRRSMDRRNNLICDLNNRLIYYTSSYVIFINLNNLLKTVNLNNNIDNNNTFENLQTFFIPVENLTQSIQNEISCIALSSDKQEIAIALNGEISLINVYEINTMTNISKFSLEIFPIINNLKFSYCKEKILGNAINRNYYNVIFILNIKQNKLESFYFNSGLIPYKIKDFEFEYKRSDIFITCGIQHLSIWQSKGSCLVNKNISLVLEKENNNANKSNLINSNKNNFYAKKNIENKRDKNYKIKNKIIDTNSDNEDISNDEKNDQYNIQENNLSDNINLTDFEVIPMQLKNKKYGVFLLNEKEKIEEFINYNFCSKENYKKYYLNLQEESEFNENNENEQNEEEENFIYKTKDLESEINNSGSKQNESNDKSQQTSEVYNTEEIERQNFTNNFNFNYYFNNFLHVSFLCIKRIKRNFILAGDDGNIYLMQNYILKYRIPAHSGYITTMEINEENKYLLTGGLDGKINLFNISMDSKGIIRNIYKINTFFTYNNHIKDLSLNDILLDTNFNVQSICIFNNKIIVGTRNGNILNFDINYMNEDKNNEALSINNLNKLSSQKEEILKIDVMIQNQISDKNNKLYSTKNILLNFFDDNPPIDIAIDSSSKRIFCISSQGFFYVYTKKNFKLVHTQDFKMKVKKIYHFKYQNKLLIVFENSLCVLDTTIINRGEKKNFNSNEDFVRIPIFDLNTGLINDLKISSNEKLMAIASVNNSIPQLYM